MCVSLGTFGNDRKNPHAVLEATQADRTEAKRRAAIAIPAFEAVARGRMWDQSDEDTYPGYPDGVQYASAPRTRYQARAREGIAEDADVELHYTGRFSDAVVERLVDYLIFLYTSLGDGVAEAGCLYLSLGADDDVSVCNVAIEPGADWRSLPQELPVAIGARDSEETSSTRRDVRYSRLNGDGHFRTAMTTVAPNAQGSTLIHPTVRFFLMIPRRKFT